MRYRDITFAPDDIEWDRPAKRADPFAEGYFMLFMEENGLDDSLRHYTRLHREIANELIRADITDPTVSRWAGRTVMRCARAKRCRQRLRAMLRNRDGAPAAQAEFDSLDAEYPRAVRGKR